MIQVTYLMTIHKVFGMARIKVSYNVGMVFGVFDGLHQGHKHFLQAAAKRCKQLIVVVTVPAVVSVLKKHKPRCCRHTFMATKICSCAQRQNHWQMADTQKIHSRCGVSWI